MSAVATLKAPTRERFVQQTFDWDHVATQTAYPGIPLASIPRARISGASSPQAGIPQVQPTTSVRQGRCERVGGMMATVLAKYGISAEEFRAAVEELRASRRNGR